MTPVSASLSEVSNNAPTKNIAPSATDLEGTANPTLVAEPKAAVDKRSRIANSDNVEVKINGPSCVDTYEFTKELKLSANQEQEETTQLRAKADSLQTSLIKATASTSHNKCLIDKL